MHCLEWSCDFVLINILGLCKNKHYCIIYGITKEFPNFTNTMSTFQFTSTCTRTIPKMMGGEGNNTDFDHTKLHCNLSKFVEVICLKKLFLHSANQLWRLLYIHIKVCFSVYKEFCFTFLQDNRWNCWTVVRAKSESKHEMILWSHIIRDCLWKLGFTQ